MCERSSEYYVFNELSRFYASANECILWEGVFLSVSVSGKDGLYVIASVTIFHAQREPGRLRSGIPYV